ncbi:MAG TPA: class I SAM-dependent methyltransferase, partial [Dokdonella sp.]
GSGNCDTEVRVALLLKEAGLTDFTIECVDMNRHMLERGRAMAAAENVAAHIRTVEADFNRWRATQRYAGVLANQSLHHVMNLEGLFDEIKRSLLAHAFFVTSDMIGRNGHLRWPEALHEVGNFWNELPSNYRYNRQLERHEPMYENWDCSTEGFEGIRAQDILPLLLERFDFRVFIGFGNLVDVFIDRSFGHNFDAAQTWDRAFIDRVHAFDEHGFAQGTLKPTHMMAVMTGEPGAVHECARGLSARASVRDPAAEPRN